MLGLLALLSACDDGSQADGGDRDLLEEERTEDADGDGDLPDGEWPDVDEADPPEEDGDPDTEISEIDKEEDDLDTEEPEADPEEEGDSDRDEDDPESDDSEDDGPETEADAEENIEVLFPETGACPPFPRKLARWVGDFPRVPTGRHTQQVQQISDGSTVLSGPPQITLFSEDEKPITFFPSPGGRMISETRPGVWHTIVRGIYDINTIYRLDESAPEWGWTVETDSVENTGRAIFNDSRGILWVTDHFGASSKPLYRWDGQQGWNLELLDVPDFLAAGIVSKTFECRGQIFFFGCLHHQGNSNYNGIILGLTKEERFLKVLWESDNSWHKPFMSASVHPETCDFVAAGYRLLVEGNLLEPQEIQVLQEHPQIPPWMIWKDWESGDLYGVPANACNEGRTFFARLRSGETHFESVPDDGIEDLLTHDSEQILGFYNYWVPRAFSGRTLDDLFVAAADVPYRYNPRKDGFEIAYRHPLLKKPNIMENAIVRSIVVGERDGRFRVHATGYGLPVMRRKGCLEWEEAFPDSDWAMALDDTGEIIWVAGEHPNLMRGAGDDWREISGGGWERAREVIALPDGRLYVLGEVGIPNVTAERFLYLYIGSQQTSRSGWRMLDFTEPEYAEWTPLQIVRDPRGDILMLVERKLYDKYTLTRDVFRITGDRMEFIASFPYRSTLSNHDGEVTVNTCEGVFVLDSQSGETTEVVPEEVNGYSTCFYDSLRLSDGRWQLLKYNGVRVYDPASGEFEESVGFSEGLNAVEPDWEFPEYEEFMRGMVVLQALPTGEILAGGVEGRILLKLLDE